MKTFNNYEDLQNYLKYLYRNKDCIVLYDRSYQGESYISIWWGDQDGSRFIKLSKSMLNQISGSTLLIKTNPIKYIEYLGRHNE